MEPKFTVGQLAFFTKGCFWVNIKKVEKTANSFKYYCLADCNLMMWIPEKTLSTEQSPTLSTTFDQHTANLLVVDHFYKDPDFIRAFALEQEYEPNLKQFKGRRTKERFLWPFLREHFEKLLGNKIVDWLNQPCNGCFQITGFNDPLVWHSDQQSYAAAIYLTPNAPVSAGTSFWRDKQFGCRRPPTHPLELQRLEEEKLEIAKQEVFSQYNLLHQDNWELVDKVGAIYNRLAIWDAKMIHSASSYEGLESDVAEKARLVQLFFFTVEN